MELSYFHRIVILLAFIILGFGIFSSVTQRVSNHYNEVARISMKYDLLGIEPISSEPRLFTQAWLKNMMVTSLMNNVSQEIPEDAQQLIIKLDNPSPTDNMYILSFPADKSLTTIERELSKLPSVSFVEPNIEVSLQFDISDDNVASVKKKIPKQKTKISPQVTYADYKVAIIDSGVDRKHPSFKDKKLKLHSYNRDATDNVGHGTHLAGLVYSYAPDVTIYSYKFTDGKTGSLGNVLRAINRAAKDNVDLVNLSLGLSERSLALQEAINLLRKQGIIIVAAAGNQNTDQEFYPAAFNGVIAVGGLNNQYTKLPNSNYGRWVNYSVKGQDVYSTAPDSGYKYLTGTSQSAAILSGMIAAYYTTPNQKQTLENYLLSKKVTAKDDFKNLLGTRIKN